MRLSDIVAAEGVVGPFGHMIPHLQELFGSVQIGGSGNPEENFGYAAASGCDCRIGLIDQKYGWSGEVGEFRSGIVFVRGVPD